MDFQIDRPHVTLVGADPLAHAALASALTGLGGDVAWAGARLAGDDEAYTYVVPPGVVVWDDGAEGAGVPPIEAGAVLALVADGARARVVLAAGARGALLRDADGRRVAAALAAIEAGLVVLDPPLAEALLSGAPAAPIEVAVTWPEPLSPRELEVLELLAEGLSNKQIGVQLAISPHTAKFHVNTILDKLDAQTRTEAVVRAARTGLLTL